jgi:hypothetical protein
MHITRLLTALAAAIALAAPAAAHAYPDAAPPFAGGVECDVSVKKRVPLAAVERRGLPVKVRCTGPARFRVMLDFPAMSRQSIDLTSMSAHSVPSTIGSSGEGSLAARGSATLRGRLIPIARRIARRYRRTRVTVILISEREDGQWWSEPALIRRTLLVR